MPEIVDQIGLQIVVDDQTAGKIQVINTQLKSVASAASNAGQVSAGSSEKAKESFHLWGEKTRQLQYALANMGGEVGKTASHAVHLSHALEVVKGAASPLGIAVLGVTAAVGFMWKAFNDAEQLEKSKEAIKTVESYLKSLDQTLQSFYDRQNNVGPQAASLRETRKQLDVVMQQQEDLEKYKKGLLENVGPGAFVWLAKGGEINEQLEALAQKRRDLESKESEQMKIVEKERTEQNNEALKKVIDNGTAKLKAQEEFIKKELEAEKRRVENMNAFRKWQKDQASEKLGMEYDANVKATESWMKEQSPQQREEEIARGHFAVLADIEKDYYKQKEEWRKEDLQAQREYERARRESVRQWIDVSQAGMDATMQVAGMFDLFGEKSAKNEEERAKAVGMRLGFENTIMAATETARSVSSWPDVPSMVMHGIAAALHTAAAIKCFADPSSVAGGGGGMGGGGGGAGAMNSGSQQAMQWARESEDRKRKLEGTGGGVTINIYGNQINAQGADREFANGVARWYKQQNPNASTGRL